MTTSKKNGRRPKKNKIKTEDDLKKKTNQSTKINLISYDTIVNSPSIAFYGNLNNILRMQIFYS